MSSKKKMKAVGKDSVELSAVEIAQIGVEIEQSSRWGPGPVEVLRRLGGGGAKPPGSDAGLGMMGNFGCALLACFLGATDGAPSLGLCPIVTSQYSSITLY